VNNLLAPHLNEVKTFNADQIVQRLIYSMVNEATLCLEEGVVDTVQAVDAAMILGAGFPPFTGGLLRYADVVGTRSIVDTLSGLADKVDSRFAPSETLKRMVRGGEVFYP
jgi:3-hydroxyacyl-CoA dehydrogenase/enoyl-CoA hydratase/3-hydroxybutyryl-CoA epimerase